MTTDTYIRAAKLSALPPGAKTVVEIHDKSVLLCNSNGKLHAVSNICSHALEKLDCGRLGAGWIACPIHGARFDLATGQAKNPPATRPIPVYPLRVVDDWIEVQI